MTELLRADDGAWREITASLPEGPVRVLDVTTSAEVEAFVTGLELGRTSPSRSPRTRRRTS